MEQRAFRMCVCFKLAQHLINISASELYGRIKRARHVIPLFSGWIIGPFFGESSGRSRMLERQFACGSTERPGCADFFRINGRGASAFPSQRPSGGPADQEGKHNENRRAARQWRVLRGLLLLALCSSLFTGPFNHRASIVAHGGRI